MIPRRGATRDVCQLRLLELFSGSGSFSKVAKALGWETLSLDIEAKFKPDLLMSIADFDETQYPKDYFTMVHASPPCTEYSRCLTTRPRDLESADKLALIALRILTYFAEGGAMCTLENPYSGLLKERPFMQEHRHRMRVLDYCKYKTKYRKRTCFWTWNSRWQPRPLCKYDCEASVGRRHIASAQRGPDRMAGGGRDQNHYTQAQLYAIPSALCRHLVFSASHRVQHYDEILRVLNEINFPTARSGRHIGLESKCFTLGCTQRPLGSSGFHEKLPSGQGVNRSIVPAKIDNTLGLQLWNLLQEEAKQLGYEFSSVQVNLNFPGQAHRDRHNTIFSYCTCLGEFTGGDFCWQENESEFSACTKGSWLKVDGRHLHWVEPYLGTRYSLVLYSILDHPPCPIYYTENGR